MEWYYADGNERRGPVNDAQLKQLESAGKIGPDTLVWNVTLATWQPYRTVASAEPPPVPAREGWHRCIILGQEFPENQMVKTEHGWVSAEAKDTYYQSLREGLAIPVHIGETNARRDGKKFVVPVDHPKLPARCVKTNAPVAAGEQKEKTLYWCTPWVWIAIVLIRLLGLILYLVLRKKVKLVIPLTTVARRSITVANCIAAALIFVGLFVLIYGIVDTVNPAVAIGPLMMLGGLIYALLKGQNLRITRIRNGEAWIAGAGPEFLASLPTYR